MNTRITLLQEPTRNYYSRKFLQECTRISFCSIVLFYLYVVVYVHVYRPRPRIMLHPRFALSKKLWSDVQMVFIINRIGLCLYQVQLGLSWILFQHLTEFFLDWGRSWIRTLVNSRTSLYSILKNPMKFSEYVSTVHCAHEN